MEYYALQIRLPHLDAPQTVDVTVPHPQPAVTRTTLRVEDVHRSRVELLVDVEEFRSHSRVNDRWLQHSRKYSCRCAVLDHSAHNLFALVSVVVFALVFSVRVLTPNLDLDLHLGTGSGLLFLMLKLLLKLADDLHMFLIRLSQCLFHFDSILDGRQTIQFREQPQRLHNLTAQFMPIVHPHQFVFTLLSKDRIGRLDCVGVDTDRTQKETTGSVALVILKTEGATSILEIP